MTYNISQMTPEQRAAYDAQVARNNVAPNRYLAEVKPGLQEAWAAYLAENAPLTKEQYLASPSGSGPRPPSVWKTIPDGKGGTIRVQSGGPEDRAYQAMRGQFFGQAAQKSWDERVAAGWQVHTNPRTGRQYLTDPSGSRTGPMGYGYGRYAYPESYGGQRSPWQDQLRRGAPPAGTPPAGGGAPPPNKNPNQTMGMPAASAYGQQTATDAIAAARARQAAAYIGLPTQAAMAPQTQRTPAPMPQMAQFGNQQMPIQMVQRPPQPALQTALATALRGR